MEKPLELFFFFTRTPACVKVCRPEKKKVDSGIFVLPPLRRSYHRQKNECNFKYQLAERKEIGGR